MVVPLDYSRSERGRQLTQNLNQYFNMAGNETTALSLAQAVKSRDFTNAMMNRLYINGRFGR
jgi:SLT domain-containing protein